MLDGLFESTWQYRKIMRNLMVFKADVLIFRNQTFKFGPFWVGKATGLPVVLETNSLRSMESRLRRWRVAVTWPTRWAENYAASAADAIFTVSKPILEKMGGIAKIKPCIVIENGVDCDIFDPGRYPKQDAKRKLGLKNKKVIGYVGSYMPWHDLDSTIETLQILQGTDPNFHLVLIGNGVDYKRIQKKVAEKRLLDAVTFINSVPHEQISQFLAAFDVALMSYPRADNFYFSPLKLFEYLAMGLTVVATNVGQIGQILTHGENGILIEKPTPENFAQGIQLGIRNAKKIGFQARKLVMENYSWIDNAAKIVKLAQSTIERKASVIPV
jgi:glycosyltransferase involved in cell wall biosynthesis